MTQFLYTLHLTRPNMLSEGPTERERQVVGQHFAHLKALVDAGTVLMAGRTTNDDARTFGIVILDAAAQAEAEALMRDDPAVKHGVMRAELHPFRVALWSTTPPHNGADPA